MRLIDLKKHEGWMDFADLLEQNQTKEFIVSLPAGVGSQLNNERNFISNMKDTLDLDIHIFFPIDRQKSTLMLLKNAIETFDKIVWERGGWSDDDQPERVNANVKAKTKLLRILDCNISSIVSRSYAV